MGVALLCSINHDFAPKKRSPFLAIKAEYLRHMILGFNIFAADLIWLRLVQDIDYKTPGRQEKGWVFQMIDGITQLDPRFRMPYASGATVLSVLIQDVEGARIIFERAAKQFPSDWSLLYRAGYHSLYEVKDCAKAAEYFNAAVFNGAPQWVAALSARLYSRAGQIEIGRSVLIDAIERFKGSEVEAHLRKRLEQLEKAKFANEPGQGPLVCDPQKSGA